MTWWSGYEDWNNWSRFVRNLGAEAMLLRLVEILKDKLGSIALVIETTSASPPSKTIMEGIDIVYSRFTPKKPSNHMIIASRNVIISSTLVD